LALMIISWAGQQTMKQQKCLRIENRSAASSDEERQRGTNESKSIHVLGMKKRRQKPKRNWKQSRLLDKRDRQDWSPSAGKRAGKSHSQITAYSCEETENKESATQGSKKEVGDRSTSNESSIISKVSREEGVSLKNLK